MAAGPLFGPSPAHTQDLAQGGEEESRGPRLLQSGQGVELWADPVGKRSSWGTGCFCLGLFHHEQPQIHSCLPGCPAEGVGSISPQKQLCSLEPATLKARGKATGSDSLRRAWKLHTSLIKKNGSVNAPAPGATFRLPL